ncbi:MAG: hypothetical protein JOY62_04015 [Acidobacteriaceae bacterium]|nr:hypothetical protein [Acidobacteriaceae bacterium]MBV9779118.1 hypothetical protein [Acidobacteriaceae bacterium]
MTNTRLLVLALAYLLTFSPYGTHLPGSEKGWIDAQRCTPGSPLGFNPGRQAFWRAHLNEMPFVLNRDAQQITLDTMQSVCTHRQWIAHALHVRTTHVHAVVSGTTAPERIIHLGS